MHSILDDVDHATQSVSLLTVKNEAQQLFAAVTRGDVEQVKALLTATPAAAAAAAAPSTDADSSSSVTATPAPTVSVPLSVNLRDSAGFTPLIIASRLGHSSLVDYLLTFPDIDVNVCTEHGNTAFLYACAKKKVGIVKALMQAGANFFATNDNQDICLMYAAIGGSDEVFFFLLDALRQIREAKEQRARKQGLPSAGQGRSWISARNDEGSTVLMCAVMGGSPLIVLRTLAEVRREMGIYVSEPPSALKHFYPSIWESALGPACTLYAGSNGNYDEGAPIDPSPPVFLSYINAQNVMGDTALHIAAQNQMVDLYLALLEDSGADPMKMNRRGQRTFELFEEKDKKINSKSSGEDANAAATAASSSSSSSTASSSLLSIQNRVHDFLRSLLDFQRDLRDSYRAQQASTSDKLFSELMEEEETNLAQGGAKKNKGNKANQKVNAAVDAQDKKKKNKKKGGAAAAAAAATTTVAAAPVTAKDSDSDNEAESGEDEPTSPALAPASSSSSSTAPAVAAPLSSSAAPFVPLATLAAIDAASGWEVVKQKEKKKPTIAAAAVSSAGAESNASNSKDAKSEKKTNTEEVKSPARKKDKSKKTKSKNDKKNETTAATTTTATSAAAAVVSSPTLTPSSPPVNPSVAPASTSSASSSSLPPSVHPLPSSSFFSSFSMNSSMAKTRAWRPSTAASHPSRDAAPIQTQSNNNTPIGQQQPVQQRRQLVDPAMNQQQQQYQQQTFIPQQQQQQQQPSMQPYFSQQQQPLPTFAPSFPSSSSPSSSPDLDSYSDPASTLSSLQSSFSSLHPHVDSLALSLSHFLGSDWSALSLSQLTTLSEIYSALSRQTREQQLSQVQQQQQEIMSELVRTKSEISAMRREQKKREEHQQEEIAAQVAIAVARAMEAAKQQQA